VSLQRSPTGRPVNCVPRKGSATLGPQQWGPLQGISFEESPREDPLKRELSRLSSPEVPQRYSSRGPLQVVPSRGSHVVGSNIRSPQRDPLRAVLTSGAPQEVPYRRSPKCVASIRSPSEWCIPRSSEGGSIQDVHFREPLKGVTSIDLPGVPPLWFPSVCPSHGFPF
jgi:hypothetical protein